VSVFRNILVTHDGSDDSRAALELAVELARDQNARLTLLTVVPDTPGSITSVAAGPYDLESIYSEILRTAAATIPDDVPVTAVLQRGSPAQRIAAVAADGHDLVVMGTHGRGRLGEALAGSVSRAVVHSLRGAVLLTRAPEAETVAPDEQPD
jgi:nucleotide-binding universal stress UspA family protein